MALQLQWADDEKTILHLRFPLEWTSQDLIAALQETQTYSVESPDSISAIVTFEGEFRPPRNLLQMLPTIGQFASAQFELAVIVMEWRDVSLFYRLFRRIAPQVARRLRFCNNVERACDIITEYRTPPSPSQDV